MLDKCYRDNTVISKGFLLAGGGCGGGPRFTDEADEMEDPDVEPFNVLGFHDDCVDDIVSVEFVRLA